MLHNDSSGPINLSCVKQEKLLGILHQLYKILAGNNSNECKYSTVEI
jgi:hypothetical protein